MILSRFKDANLSNSIYQQKGAGIGLSVNNGMLINNRPDSTTGIQKACEINKMKNVAQKVEIMSRAMTISKMECEDNDDMYSGPSVRY